MDETRQKKVFDERPKNGSLSKNKENLNLSKSPGNAGGSSVIVEPSIEELYDNVYDMQSSDESVSRLSYGSDGEESRIDSELRHLVGGEMREVEILKENEEGSKQNEEESSNSHSPKNSKKAFQSQFQSEANSRSSPKSKTPQKSNLLPRKRDKKSRKLVVGDKDSDHGPSLLKQARDMMSSNTNPHKALDLALRATSSFEKSSNGKPSLDIVMCLHITAAIYCSLGQFNEAIHVLEESIKIPIVNENQDYGLAKFSGLMQLGDTYSMLGQLENSLKCYTIGLEVQKSVLGDFDPSIGETCRYLSEAHVQALEMKEAEIFCDMAIEIHVKNGLSSEEAADRRLMGLISETKGDHEGALEHLVLAGMSMVANWQENEVSYIDLSIGDIYLSLSRFDEAIFAYQKALKSLKKSKGENHPSVASVFTQLADLCNKTGKLKESKSFCENALHIYENPVSGIPPEEIACGFTNISNVYESLEEFDKALELLHKALRIYKDVAGQQSTIASIEAQMGVMYYVLGKYSESYNYLKSGILKMRVSSEKKSGFYGVALNQMGLTCVQRYAINEAIECFEEARSVLERECGSFHPDTLSVHSNLAGTYDAVGRLDDAIEILEHIVQIKEEKLGIAGFDVEDEKKRLVELLKEAGKVRSRKARSLENLFDPTYQSRTNNDAIKTLDIVAENPDKFRAAALAAGSNVALLAEQVKALKPQLVSIRNESLLGELKEALADANYMPEIIPGEQGVIEVARHPDCVTVVTGIVGCAGLKPTVAAIEAGKNIALANKETLIAGGLFVLLLARKHNVKILPADSEHSAIFQCIQGFPEGSLLRIILTASGLHLDWPVEKLKDVKVADALKHPNWSMGKKITVDSATLFNKGLEVIEAHYLYGLDYDNIEIVIHPGYIIHSMVETQDSSVLAQLGWPDMRLYTLSWPDRIACSELTWPHHDLCKPGSLTFKGPDNVKYPSMDLAYSAGRGTMAGVLGAAYEKAVEMFIEEKIRYLDIFKVVELTCEKHQAELVTAPSLEEIVHYDLWA